MTRGSYRRAGSYKCYTGVMKNHLRCLCFGLLTGTALLLLADTSAAQGKLPIELDVAIAPGASLTAPQKWAERLGRMNLANVRLRQVRPNDQPSVKTVKVGSASRYQVTAILSSNDQLVFPNKKFQLGQRGSLQSFLNQLPKQTEHTAQERGRFDLTEPQFNRIYAEFSKTIQFKTEKLPLRQFVRQVESDLSTPFKTDAAATVIIREQTTQEELKGISLGTAMSIAFREHGLVVRPEQKPGQPLCLVIERYSRGREAWPAGWKPEQSVRKIAPVLFKQLTIEANRITFGKVLAQLEPKLQLPIIMDRFVLNQKRIQPDEVPVKMARRKTYLKGAVDRLASQAKLATEIRVDEQDKPFLWLTQFGKDSPQAAQ